MAGTTEIARPRMIVIPRPLEGYFHERLLERFAGRDDVIVIVDRRVGERRRQRWATGPGPLTDRRRRERRGRAATWSLPEMPFSAS